MKRRLLSALLTLALVFTGATALAHTADELGALVSESAEYMENTLRSPQVGSIGGEWAVIGLVRSGYPVPQSYLDGYYSAVVEYIDACKGVLHDKKYTEYSRVTLALTAIGADPTDVGGYNLLAPLGDFEKTIWQGINGPTWALIALDSGGYEMPVNNSAKTQAARQMYIDEILSRQTRGGGWSLLGSVAGTEDVDVTAMVLQALAKYQVQSAVKAATDEALQWLSDAQGGDGGFSSWGTANCESVVQTIVALTELGIGLDDTRFVKNGVTLLDNLLTFRQPDGSFLHTLSGSGSNQMASEQGLYALVAAHRAINNKSSLYRMDDAGAADYDFSEMDTGLAGKHADVQKAAIAKPGVTFEDISAHGNQVAVEALAARGIIDGLGDGSFGPDRTMTRAQFAAIVARALGLPREADSSFSDVPSGEWYAPYVGTASAYGIVNGVGDNKFNPGGMITRQEAAVMVSRAAALCGMDTDYTAAMTLDVLSQFGDYRTVEPWAEAGLAFCYGADILDQSDLGINPKENILRCEVAQMLFNMLSSAKLL